MAESTDDREDLAELVRELIASVDGVGRAIAEATERIEAAIDKLPHTDIFGHER